MGYIAKRGTRAKPLFYVQFKDRDGAYKMRAIKGARTREDAAKERARIEARVANGEPGMVERDDRPAACGSLFDTWLESLSNRNAADDRLRAQNPPHSW